MSVWRLEQVADFHSWDSGGTCLCRLSNCSFHTTTTTTITIVVIIVVIITATIVIKPSSSSSSFCYLKNKVNWATRASAGVWNCIIEVISLVADPSHQLETGHSLKKSFNIFQTRSNPLPFLLLLVCFEHLTFKISL